MFLKFLLKGPGTIRAIFGPISVFPDDFYSKSPTKNFFYFLQICSLQYA